MSTWSQTEAELAFSAIARRRRRAELVARIRRACRGLAVIDERCRAGASRMLGRREIALDAISGTTEPNRAAQFDRDFLPSPHTRARWQRIWMAMHRGTSLPPISVVQVGDSYAVRDGHHRVSVAKTLGAPTISAVVVG